MEGLPSATSVSDGCSSMTRMTLVGSETARRKCRHQYPDERHLRCSRGQDDGFDVFEVGFQGTVPRFKFQFEIRAEGLLKSDVKHDLETAAAAGWTTAARYLPCPVSSSFFICSAFPNAHSSQQD